MLMSMKRDARKLQPIVQEELRRRAVAAIHGGMRQVEAAEVFGVARKTVWQWLTAYTTSGDSGLVARKRGPKRGGGKLKGWQAAAICNLIRDRHPRARSRVPSHPGAFQSREGKAVLGGCDGGPFGSSGGTVVCPERADSDTTRNRQPFRGKRPFGDYQSRRSGAFGVQEAFYGEGVCSVSASIGQAYRAKGFSDRRWAPGAPEPNGPQLAGSTSCADGDVFPASLQSGSEPGRDA